MDSNIIEIYNLTKIFKLKGNLKEIKALNNINISVKKGEIFGLLGPNGAGKTTLIQILTTLLQPTSGYAVIDGFNVLTDSQKAKSNIALMLESNMLYYRITGYDNLKFFCKIYKVQGYKEKIKEIAKEFELDKWLNQYVEHYSSGMKMKLALCRTLLLNRKILILDEPSLGLDVKSVSNIIDRLKKTNSTIFLTSHDMNFVEKMCDRIAFINKGEIIKIGTKKDIENTMKNEIRIEVEVKENKNQLKLDLLNQNFISNITDIPNGYIISLKKREYIKNLLSILANYDVLSIKEIEQSIEDLFLKII